MRQFVVLLHLKGVPQHECSVAALQGYGKIFETTIDSFISNSNYHYLNHDGTVVFNYDKISKAGCIHSDMLVAILAPWHTFGLEASSYGKKSESKAKSTRRMRSLGQRLVSWIWTSNKNVTKQEQDYESLLRQVGRVEKALTVETRYWVKYVMEMLLHVGGKHPGSFQAPLIVWQCQFVEQGLCPRDDCAQSKAVPKSYLSHIEREYKFALKSFEDTLEVDIKKFDFHG
ncbi:hypothetical protein RFI_35759 [Reticulomyxa filosa]|uniref:Uncharacterized protein n=1 Tax=Reticulomyxa filosa TaxID=46433 RepID=X6LJX5_RETFI|nr:hypothetical protein RFI_35759 [Reticulomyxa filosa]|eukprot:ETO01681.1 hypothetical protein RFI_35759 [Reticulomyxa filosa]